MAEIVLALRIILHIFPLEVDAATRAFFTNSLEKVHGGLCTPVSVGSATMLAGSCSSGAMERCCSVEKEYRADYHMSKQSLGRTARPRGSAAQRAGAGGGMTKAAEPPNVASNN